MKIAVSFRSMQWWQRRRAGFVFWIVPNLIEVNEAQLKEIQSDEYLTLHPVDSYNFRVAEDNYTKKTKEENIEKEKQNRKKVVVKKDMPDFIQKKTEAKKK